jgi:hypothetical protein
MPMIVVVASDRRPNRLRFSPFGQRFALVAACFVVLGLIDLRANSAASSEVIKTEPRMIGATTTVVESSSGFPFPARVDTGATSCSIHCETFEIKNPAPAPKDNVGKPVRILLKNPDGEENWIETKIVSHVRVRTSEQADDRYKVRLKLRTQDVEKKVLVTLNDREKMKYPVLIGRNFLRGDFLVDVDLDGDE